MEKGDTDLASLLKVTFFFLSLLQNIRGKFRNLNTKQVMQGMHIFPDKNLPCHIRKFQIVLGYFFSILVKMLCFVYIRFAMA